MQLLAESPINLRADKPVEPGHDADRREKSRQTFLRQRALVQTIANRGADGLTPKTRRLAIEDLRGRSSIDVDAVEKLAADLTARDDAAEAEAAKVMATWRKDLKPSERDRPEASRVARETAYGEQPPRRQPDRLIYDDTRLREIVETLAPCRHRGDGLAFESELLGDLWPQEEQT
jgi:hypothetical protein